MKKALSLLIFALLLVSISCKKTSVVQPPTTPTTKTGGPSTAPPYPTKAAETFATTPGTKSAKTLTDPEIQLNFGDYTPSTGSTACTIHENKSIGSAYDFYLVNAADYSLVTILDKTLTSGGSYLTNFTYPPGTYQIYATSTTYGGHSSTFDSGTEALSPVFHIYAKPADPPSGYLNLYRYYNSQISRHFYSTNWNEIGPIGQGYQFEGVQGILYSSPGTNLYPLYEYYNSATYDHWYTTNSSGYTGYTSYGIIGYLPTAATTQATQVLNEYFASNTGHFYCSPPEYPDDSWSFDTAVGYLIPATTTFSTPQPIYLYYSASAVDHFTTPDPNVTSEYSGWSNYGVSFHAYTSSMPGTTPVYEFYNSASADHFDSIDPNAVAGYSGWVNDGIKFYAYTAANAPSGTVPIYLFYYSGDHYISPNASAVDGYSGWSNYGTAFYAYP